MKNQLFKCCSWLCFGLVFAIGLLQANRAFGQNCPIEFTGPAGNVLNCTIVAYPNYPNSDAHFAVLVQDNSQPIPIGTYLTWCVDEAIDIEASYTFPGTPFTGLLLPTCDTNLNFEVSAGHTPTFYVSPAVWQQVNYLLNHKNGAPYWAVQVAIWHFVGGPAPASPPFPPYDPAVAQSLIDNAVANAATWSPKCGDVIGAIYDIKTQAGVAVTNVIQLLMLEVPYCPVTFVKCPQDLQLGCNPDTNSIPTGLNPVDTNLVNAVSCCGHPVTISCSKSEASFNCSTYRILTYTATDGYGNTATCIQNISWTADTNAPLVVVNAPATTDLGCNPATLPTDTTVGALVAVRDDCSLLSTNISHLDSGSSCAMTRTFTISATDACGNISAPQVIVYTWKVDTNAPVLVKVPTGADYGCNPASLPTVASITAQISVADNCTVQSTNVTYQDTGTPCAMTRTFTISATDGCGNISAAQTVVYTWKADTNAPVLASIPAGADLGCNPASLPTVASITAQIIVADDCTVQSTNVTSVDSGTSCAMTRTFTISATDACGNISAPKKVVYTWKIDTNAPVLVSVPANADLGCNPASLPTVASITAQIKVADDCTVQRTNVTFVDAGTPCAMTRTFTISATDGCGNTSAIKKVVYTWKADTNAPVISNLPTGADLGCNPANVPTDASVAAQLVVLDDCLVQSTNVTHQDVTNNCKVTRTFSLTAVDGCGNAAKPVTVVYTWIADTTPPVIVCPPDITLSNSVVPYCTYTPGDYGSVCNGSNAASILTNCFKKVYLGGYLQCGTTNSSGHYVKFTGGSYVQKFVTCGGTPSYLNGCYNNPTTCEAGSFSSQALCLKLNVDLGDCKSVSGFAGGCGDLVLNDRSCSLHGKSVRQILDICHKALGGDDISGYGCKISDLNLICSNLNQSFQGCHRSDWCKGHLVPPAITNVTPAVTGYATVVDKCTSTPVLTYSDVITPGSCDGNYTIARTWVAVDGCGNTNYCTQNIYVGASKGNVCGTVFADCNGDGFLTAGFDSGISNVVVTLKNGSNVVVATNTTDAQGGYCFYNLTAGTYTVSIVQPAGSAQTAGTHNYHWVDDSGRQCWLENDNYQHLKGADGVDRWSSNDGCQHWKNSYQQDCWNDKYGVGHTQSCNYVSCDAPKTNSETFTLAPCESKSFVNFAYQGVVAKPVICVTGPGWGKCGQYSTYTCTITNTGNACFNSCQVTVCGKTYTCPALGAGQGCSFPVNYQFQWGDCGTFNCKATALCTYLKSSTTCSAQSSCNTYVSYW